MYDMIRNGMRVRFVESWVVDPEDHWNRQPVFRDDVIGTVVRVDEDTDMDGYDSIVGVQVRWDNGKLETFSSVDDFDWDDLHDVTPRLFVNVYLVDRCYGGPEEGGWWYDTASPDNELSVECETEDEAKKAYAKLGAELLEENEGRPDISSVISRGRYTVRLEAFPGEAEPKRRPHYC